MPKWKPRTKQINVTRAPQYFTAALYLITRQRTVPCLMETLKESSAIQAGMNEDERYKMLKDKQISVVTGTRTAQYAEEIASLEALQTKARPKKS